MRRITLILWAGLLLMFILKKSEILSDVNKNVVVTICDC